MNQLGLRFTIPTRVSVASSPNRFISRRGTRALHQRQALPYPAEHGLGKFLPPEALKVQLEYQDGLLERLNEQLGGVCTLPLYFLVSSPDERYHGSRKLDCSDSDQSLQNA